MISVVELTWNVQVGALGGVSFCGVWVRCDVSLPSALTGLPVTASAVPDAGLPAHHARLRHPDARELRSAQVGHLTRVSSVPQEHAVVGALLALITNSFCRRCLCCVQLLQHVWSYCKSDIPTFSVSLIMMIYSFMMLPNIKVLTDKKILCISQTKSLNGLHNSPISNTFF